ncbi:unnamed protein product [Musa acuminata subsp. burmannicoides]
MIIVRPIEVLTNIESYNRARVLISSFLPQLFGHVVVFGKVCLFGYQTRFGNLLEWYMPVCTSALVYSMLVHTGVLMRKKKRVKRRGSGETEEKGERKKEEEEEKCCSGSVPGKQ